MSRAAIRYAKAIIDNAVSNGKTDSVNNDMNNIIAAINESHELEVFLASPVVPSEIKLNALFEIFSDSNEETKALFKLLSANKRFGILQEIALRYKTLYNEINGLEIAKVTTAVALTPELESKILAKAATMTTKKLTIENTVDSSIIGGFILRIGDMQFNASVANRLQELKREFSN